LAAASYFESKLSADVLNFCQEDSGGNKPVPAIISNKAITRQYYTWFDWKGNTATTFFNLFGADFKKYIEISLGKMRRCD
jgi:hypothetical protein